MIDVERQDVWIDCDTGHDDAFAILLAYHSRHIRPKGISTTHGNADLAKTTLNTRRILAALGYPEIQVCQGAAKPLCRQALHAPNIHGSSGLDGTNLLPSYEGVEACSNAVDAMRTAIVRGAAEERPLWIVAIGPLTNVALLFCTYPDLVHKIAGLSIMGGALAETSWNNGARIGNITPWAEFNIYCDPEAAQAVFSDSNLAQKTVLVPLDLSHQVIADPQVQDLVRHGRAQDANKLRQMFYELLMFFAKTYADNFGMTDGPPVHDPLALVAALPTSACPLTFSAAKRYQVHVITDTSAGQHGRITAVESRSGVQIPSAVDLDAFWSMIDDALSSATRHGHQ